MTSQELFEKIREHEEACLGLPGAAFEVVDVVELADGVLSVCDADGEYTIYFDKSKCWFQEDNRLGLDDESETIRSIPEGVGFICCVTARGWPAITQVARMTLLAAGRKEIIWHEIPIKVPG